MRIISNRTSITGEPTSSLMRTLQQRCSTASHSLSSPSWISKYRQTTRSWTSPTQRENHKSWEVAEWKASSTPERERTLQLKPQRFQSARRFSSAGLRRFALQSEVWDLDEWWDTIGWACLSGVCNKFLFTSSRRSKDFKWAAWTSCQ